MEHFVQFYRTDDYLVDCVAGYVSEGILRGDRTVVIATPEHRIALERRLQLKQTNVISSMVRGQYLALDARETLSRFMVRALPDPDAFANSVGEIVRNITANGQQVRAFGEMVALLWGDGNPQAAIQLEGLWNELRQKYAFSLFCGYPSKCRETSAGGVSVEDICAAHSSVISLSA